ncbi:non-ribosomal peptide synthetase [Kineosporia sp. NBRC 101731]|uniref:non-ribosomal peptide synthetase n=1 Tax=Kineosporia sp. NBRC 101731 TaxID=3032199 RepID=UPI0025564470|nr:non-ribosomal peptide synthetase [Kineosporia sp. NBRC 101731]
MTNGSVRLVPAQLGVWAAEEVSPQADAFLISQVVWLDGVVDVALLQQALAVAGAEADVLRLRLHGGSGGDPVLAPGGDMPWVRVSDIASSDDAIRAGALARCRGLAGQEERFTAGSVLHPRTAGGWAWEFFVHHVFLDAYGLGLFTRRVAEVYSALAERTTVPERWFGVYADLVDALDAGTGDSADFWRKRLAQAEDGSGARGGTSAGTQGNARFFLTDARAGLVLEDDVTAALDRLARSARVSWSDVVLAAWGLFTAARQGRDLFAVRLPQMNRQGPAALRTPAMLVGSVPVVLRVDPAQSVAQFVSRVRGEARELVRHGVAAEEELARLWPAGVEEYYALPQLNFKAFDYRYSFAQVTGRQETIANGPVGHWDMMVYRDAVHGFRFDLASSDPALTSGAVPEFLSDFIVFLTRLATADPGQRVSSLRVLPERDQVDLAQWRSGPTVEVPAHNLDDLVQAQARATAAGTALVDEDGHGLSYAEFDHQVNALAQVMVERGVRTGDRVAVLLPRTTRLVVTLAAVLRAGAAYVPIDPEYPVDRVIAILQDATPTLLVTDTAHAARAAGSRTPEHDVSVLVLDADSAMASAGDVSAPSRDRPVTGADTAYVIFTSGTTGRPKGVSVNHRAIINRLVWMRDAYAVGPGDRVLQKTPDAFDVSVWEFFLPLITGATLVVARDGGHKDPVYLAQVIEQHQVTIAHFVPSMLTAFLTSDPDPARLSSLRQIFFSGEALPATAATQAHTLFTTADLHNLYGPTEAAVDVTAHPVEPTNLTGTVVVPIGRPVQNTTTLVLDTWLRPVAPGVIGELYLGGVQIADGYLNQSALSAQRFVADPFAADGSRLYRTGDLVRWNHHGHLEYLGRSDDQIKIRGFRIELDEIRNALETHPDITAAAVLAHHHPAGGTYLAAYLTTDTSDENDAAQTSVTDAQDASLPERARQHVAAILPDYMVPTVLTVLDTLPTTPNGKLDRRALPTPNLTTTTGKAPTSTTETLLADIFTDVLHLPTDTPLSVEDDFFLLGGHSLLATRVVARANAVLGTALTLREVFEASSVQALAAVVDRYLADVEGGTPRVGQVPRPAVLPVSYGQQSLWLIEQLGGPGGRYVVPMVLRLSGDVDPDPLMHALRDVIIRHEALRTVIVENEGRLSQRILSPEQAITRLSVLTADLSGDSQHSPGATVDAWVAGVVQREFDLGRDVPIRAGLLRVDAEEWVLVLAVHHHAVDDWSFPSLLGDLSLAYRSRSGGQAPHWAPLPVQYADYAVWQRAALGDAEDPRSRLGTDLAYWRAVLAEAPQESTITLDRPRPVDPTHHGVDLTFTVGEATVQRLRQVAADQGVTMFMIAHAATAVAASVLGAGNDVVIGSPIGGRTQDGLEDLVGYFVNTLPLRHRLDPRHTLPDLLQATKVTVLEGFAHQEAPFEEIARVAGVERAANRNPLFQIMLTHTVGTAGHGLDLPGVRVAPGHQTLAAVKTDLDLYLEDDSLQFRGLLTYATDVLDPASAERFVRTLTAVLDAIAQENSGPETVLADLHLLTGADLARLRTWSAGPHADPPHPTLDAWLHTQAITHASRTALIDTPTGERLSYRDLDTRANALAHLLIDRGVQVGDRVAVLLPRSPEQVVTLTAVLRAGAAYVPIDPGHPHHRITAILRDAAPALLVTTGATHTEVTEVADRVLLLDSEATRTTLAAERGLPELSRPLTGQDTAYVTFTSGTTGRPKGVALSHRALVNRLHWGNRTLALGTTSVALSKTGLGFIDACTELFGPLTAAATTVVVPDPDARDSTALTEAVHQHGATHLLSIPSLTEVLLDHATSTPQTAAALAGLRHWTSSGETLTPHLLTAMTRATPATTIHNFYGSTEITGDATCAALSPTDGHRNVIGRPVANMSVAVLDSWLRPVAPGVMGELYLGGVQVADGYLGQPGLSAQRFVADPFAVDGSRLYRTGDLARWNDDGNLEYLGRADDQVKIRGFRIELEEIRNVLESHPQVTGAAVLAYDHPAGGTYLAAYVTGPDDPGLTGALKDFAQARLPEYMVPTVFTVLAAFPLTVNGKLDRRALPEPDLGAPTGATNGTGRGPVTATQIALARIFAEVLNLPADLSVSLDDDFFHLGGHSLLASRVAARANAVLGTRLSLREIFEAPTVEALAAVAERGLAASGTRNRAGRNASSVPALREVTRPDDLPASYGQQALWLSEQIDSSGFYRTGEVLQVQETADIGALQRAITRLRERHESLRTTFVLDETGTLRQVVHEEIPGSEALHVVTTTGPSLGAFVEELFAEPLDPATGFGLRFTLVRSPERELLIAHGHHLVTDEQSGRPLIDDLDALYRQELGRSAPVRPDLALQYGDFATWHRIVLGERDDPGSRFTADLAYWKDVLADLPEQTPLPFDTPRSTTSTRTLGSARADLSAQESGDLSALLADLAVTPLQALISAFSLALWDEGAGRAVAVGTPVNLRDDPALADLIGYFVNTVVIRADIDESLPWKDLLRSSRDRTIAALEHKLVPFESVVEHLAPRRRPGVTPLFQTMAVFFDAPPPSTDEARLLTPYQVDDEQSGNTPAEALFDLVISIERARDGHFELVLEGVRELFAQSTIARVIERTRSFLMWGTRHPHLPLEHLVQLVRVGLPPQDLLPRESVWTVHLPQFVPADAHLWQAAADQLAMSFGNDGSRGLPVLSIDDAGQGRLAADGSQNPESLDTLAELAAGLVAGYRDGTVLRIGPASADPSAGALGDLPGLLNDPFWSDWVDEVAEADPVTLPAGETVSPIGLATTHAQVLDPGSGGRARATVVAAVCRALPLDGEGDLVVALEQPRTWQQAGSFITVIDGESLSRVRTTTAQDAPATVEPLLDWSPARADEYSALISDPALARFFDDVPAATVRIGVFETDSHVPSSLPGDTPDGIEVSVRVLIARSGGPERRVIVQVTVVPGIALDPGEIAHRIAHDIGRTGVPSSASGRRAGPSLQRVSRLPLSGAEVGRIRKRYGADAEILPLSPLQSGLLYHILRARETGDHNAYISQICYDLTGTVEVEQLGEAIRTALRRHPNVRAAFVSGAEGEVQVIPALREIPYRVVRRTEWAPAYDDLAAFLDREREEPFEHEEPPLLRFALIERGEGAWSLAMTAEHILMDGWSLYAFLGEVLDLYTDPGYADRVAPASFRSYLDWVADRDPQTAEQAWSQYLDDLESPSILWPAGGDLTAARADTGDLYRDLEPAHAVAVFAAARAAGTTVGTVLQVAWAITLGRLIGNGDVVFGNNVSGRPPELPDAERIIGLLFNTLPFRVRLNPFETVEALLRRVQHEQSLVVEYSYTALTDIQKSVGLGTLFDTLFVVQNLGFEGEDESGDSDFGVTGDSSNDATHYPVTFAVNPWESDGGAGVGIRLSYRRDAFGDEAAGDLLRRFMQVLAFVAGHLAAPVAQVPALLPGEHDQVLGHTPDAVRAVEEIPVGELLNRQVLRSAGETALVAGDRRYTFEEFAAEVNRYARMLLGHGVRPEHRVALLLPRDERMIIAMFAVFAVGAAYVPVDAEHPDERIGYMLDDTRPTVTLVTDRDVARVSVAGYVVNLDDPKVTDQLAGLDAGAITAAERGGEISLDHLAYVIFTSGSTGRPKGVAVGYRGLTNMYANHVEKIFDRVTRHQGGRRMRIAHTTSFSFDASWEQLFWLLNGDEVHVIDEELRREPRRLLEHYDRERIDGFDVTPSYGQLLVDEGLLERERPSGRSVSATAAGVVFVSLGGEAVPERLWQQLREAPGVESYNLYGPTEYTINALGADLADSPTSSVGRPIFNTRAYILDENLQPALPGVPGELYLAGAGTARGYWDQSGLTAERFVACPWEPGQRMYRTGDLARWSAEGNIDYLGRTDDQVKIRGYRIEPGEVADVLSADPLVARAAVVVRQDESGSPQLFGYVVAVAGSGPDVDLDAIRARAREALPDYMIPAGIAAVADIPLTVNGKVDARALPVIETTGTDYTEPATAHEKVVAAAVADLVGATRISASANFFDVGGNSLLAMRLIARLHRDTGRDLMVKDVFARQTVRELAGLLSEGQGGEIDVASAILVPLREPVQGRVLFCIHEYNGFASIYSRLLPGVPARWGVYGLQDPVHGGSDVVISDFAHLVALYVDAIVSVQPSGPYDVLGWSYGGHIAFGVAQELRRRGLEVATLTVVDAIPTAEGPLRDDENILPAGASPERIVNDPALHEEFLKRFLAREARALQLEDDELDDLGAQQKRAWAISGMRSESMTTRPTAGVFEGPALLVAATEDRPELGYGEKLEGMWRPFLPQARRVDVDATHRALLDEGVLERWLPAAREFLLTAPLAPDQTSEKETK